MPKTQEGSARKQVHDECFPPVARADAAVLVLGSLPGRKSLQLQQYYAHPQNAFWKIIAQLFDADPQLPYAKRVALLTSNQIALWDVLAAAERPGSLDSAIVHATAKANDFAALFRSHPHIQCVFFNGRKAETLFQRFVVPRLTMSSEVHFECLPSTSPAHAGMSFAQKLAAWSVLKNR
jgi:double-stranded uracil-DNA glycosylase